MHAQQRGNLDAPGSTRPVAVTAATALGTGLSRGVFWRDMGVVNLPGGKPTLKLTGGAAKRLEEITPPGHIADIHLTITDEFPLAQAIVIIYARPAAKGPA